MQKKGSKGMLLFMLMGFTAGMVSPLQTAINGKLRKTVASPFLAAMISFLVGAVLLFILSFIVHKRIAFSIKSATKFPYWIFTGGLMGVIFIISNILLLPLLGVAMTVVLAVCGQMIIALVMDHFGLFGASPHPINRYRIIGVISMLIGIILIQSF